jgi:hypothetical protein
VAKTRRSAKASRRGSSSAAKGKSKRPQKKVQRKAGKKRASTRPSVRAGLVEPEKSIDLKALRAQFALMVSGLTKKTGSTPAVESKLDDTRRRISQWMTDIDDICTPEEEEICGPTMVFPLP